MAFVFKKPVHYLFFFCLTCWNYQKFYFQKEIDFQKDHDRFGKCLKCNQLSIININVVKDYYQNLNKNNH